jgi:hypothetical protein
MATLATWRERLHTTRATLLASLVAVPDTALAGPWPWRGGMTDIRYALLGLAEITRGLLLAELVGLPEAPLDAVPAPGEWPARRVLAHILVTERRYWRRTAWHVAEARAGRPTTAEPPAGIVPSLEEAAQHEEGSLADLLALLAAERVAALAALANLTAADLAAPTSWAGFDCDVRFRLHRFAAHERQHIVHLAKSLRAVDFRPSESQRLLGQAQITRGHLLALLVGLPDALLTRSPGPGAPTVATILAEIVATETSQARLLPASLAR